MFAHLSCLILIDVDVTWTIFREGLKLDDAHGFWDFFCHETPPFFPVVSLTHSKQTNEKKTKTPFSLP